MEKKLHTSGASLPPSIRSRYATRTSSATALLSQISEPSLKGFRVGTHRIIQPEETVAYLDRLKPIMGITRVANVTGLDHIGIPVVVVCRPNSRSLSVSQGKGLTLSAAKASGLMESAEAYHAERITQPLKLASYNELHYDHCVVEPQTLPQLSVSRYHDHLRLLWIEGYDLMQEELVWVPFEMVHLNFTLPLPEGSGCFPMSSNGLASGNHLLEAIVHGISEVVERDAYALWKWSGTPGEERTRVDLETIDDPACLELLEKFVLADMLVAVWDMTSDIGIPAFCCTIIDRETNPLRPLYPSLGMGCHPSRQIALFRALSEAAQSRLTRIASSRDDVDRAEYELTRNPDVLNHLRTSLSVQTSVRSFHDAPTWDSDSFKKDLNWLLERLRAAGIPRAIAVDLTQPGLDLPVVRIVIPRLEPKPGGPGYVPGVRAQERAAAFATVPRL